MNPDYKELRSQADRLHYRFNDVCDDKNAAAGMAGEVRNVVEDFEMNKSPRSIDDRVKRLLEELKRARSSGQPISSTDALDLIQHYEQLREELHRLPNY
jgi:hypothetical protein